MIIYIVMRGEDDMTVLEQMLSGQIEMSEYLYLLTSDFDLQDELSSIIPKDAIGNPSHSLWKCVSYHFLFQYNFDLYNCLISFHRLDDSLGDNLNIFGLIKRIYIYTIPDFPFTTQYHDAYDTYLDVVRDCYDGPEVEELVNDIIKECLTLKTKSGRKKEGQKKILELFHVVDKNKPRWIQGAEWPMGVNSPMKFVKQKRHKEQVEYLFIDVDTEEKRMVIQYY